MNTLINKLLALVIIMVTALSSTSASAETVTYYHLDALGSPVAASDESGNVLWREEYAPYGDRIRVEDPTNTHGFTGKFHEEDLGLTYFGARWYDPVVGRFAGVDSVEYRGQFDASRPGNNIPVTGNDLTTAVDKLLAGKVLPTEQTPSLGCNIKWKSGNAPEYFG